MCLYLPCGCVSPEVGKLSCKPVVDFIESQLSVWGLQNGLRTGRDRAKFQRKARGVGGAGDGETDKLRDLHDV